MLREGYLADICLIYAMISFLAVIVLTKVYMGVYTESRKAEKRDKSDDNVIKEDNPVKIDDRQTQG